MQDRSRYRLQYRLQDKGGTGCRKEEGGTCCRTGHGVCARRLLVWVRRDEAVHSKCIQTAVAGVHTHWNKTNEGGGCLCNHTTLLTQGPHWGAAAHLWIPVLLSSTLLFARSSSDMAVNTYARMHTHARAHTCTHIHEVCWHSYNNCSHSTQRLQARATFKEEAGKAT